MLLVAVAAVAETQYSQDLYERAVMGDREAMYQLSRCYMGGNGVTADYERSDYWLERAAKEGQPDAKKVIDMMGGKTALSSSKRAQLAAEEKRERERLEKNIDYSKYNDALVKKAQSGDARAQNNLGYCYENGLGVTKDYNEAVKWYRKAAEQGNAYGQYNLGLCYENGDGVSKDINQAVKWYRKAAE